MPAIVVHLLRIRSSRSESRSQGLQGLRICIRLVEGLKHTCSAAHRVVRLLSPALEKSGCSLHAASPKPADDGRTGSILSAVADSCDGPPFVCSSASGHEERGERRCSLPTPPTGPEDAGPESLNQDSKVILPTAIQIPDEPVLSTYGFDNVESSDVFDETNGIVNMAHWLENQAFADFNSPISSFVDNLLDMDWASGLIDSPGTM